MTVLADRFGRAVVVASSVIGVAALALAVHGPASGWTVPAAAMALLYLVVPAVGTIALRADPRNLMGWALLSTGFGLAARTFSQIYADLALNHGVHLPAAWLFAWFDQLFGSVFYLPPLAFALLLLPTGKLPSRRWRWAAWTIAATEAPNLAAPLAAHLWHFDAMNQLGLPGTTGDIADDLMVVGIMGLPLVYTITAVVMTARWRGTTEPNLRSALRLTTVGAWIIAVSQWICLGFGGGPLIDAHYIYLLERSAVICLAVGAWIGIVRYRLFDVRFIVNRTLLYAALTSVVVVTYGATMAVIQAVVEGSAPALAAVAVAAVVAVPMRDVLQRQANRLVYGQRHDPYAAFAQLGEQLGAVVTPGAALPRAVRTIERSLRLSYVAVESVGDVLAHTGIRQDRPVFTVPLSFEGHPVGDLTVQTASARERLSPLERRLIAGLAPQVAAAAHAQVLGEALRRSRDKLIALRDEERHRIHRDLHDGLGPTLAGMMLGLDRARRHLTLNPSKAAAILDDLAAHADTAVADVRRLAHDLRPPTLDELGLAGALRQEARRFGAAYVHTGDELPALSANVEVTAYRIAMEAMTNASRHGHATAIEVRLDVNDDHLLLEVLDDGIGIAYDAQFGVGIDSMRDRARELGGQCSVDRRQSQGTTVRALLPLAEVGAS